MLAVSYTHLDVYKRQIETRTDETPHVEPEMEIIVGDRPDRQSEEARWDHMMRMMMEQFGQVNSNFTKINENSKRDIESLNKNIESMREDLNKKIDSTHKSMDTLNSKIDDNSRAIREELNGT